jgi:hypothetical protein
MSSNYFGDLKKVHTFAARLRKNGKFIDILREIIEVKKIENNINLVC